MKDEIKEILNNINYKYKDYYVQDIVSGDDLKLLSDYITNLQEEKEDYKSRCEKVNKYIDDWLFEAGGNGACMDYEDIIEIKHILNGGDE